MGKPVRLTFIGDDTQLNAALKRVVRNTSATQAALMRLQKLGIDMAQVGRSMTMGITLPVAAAGGAAIKMSLDFEEAMSKIQGLVGVSRAQTKRWGDEILQLAPKVGKAPKELAEALYFVTSSGVSASKAMDVLKASAKASAAGLGETKDIASLVTSVMNAYGENTVSASRATDVLLRAIGEGKAEPAEFANALGSVISISAELGIKFEDVAASVAQMSLTGDNAAEATTKLRGALVKLLRPTIQGSQLLDALKESNASLRDSIAKKGLLPTIQGLYEKIRLFARLPKQQKIKLFGKESLSDLNEMQKRIVNGDFDSLLSTMFNDVRGLQGVLKLAGKSKDDVLKVFNAVKNGSNTTEKAFGVHQQTNMAKFKKAMAGLQAVAIRVGDALAPTFAAIAEKVSKLAEGFLKLSPQTRKMAIQASLLAAAVGPLVWGFGRMLHLFALIARHPVVTLLGLITTALVALYLNNEKFRKSVHNVIDDLKEMGAWLNKNRVWLLGLAGSFAIFMVVGKAVSALTAAGKVVGVLKKAWMGLSTAFALSPIGLVAAALALLVIGLVVAYKRFEGFRNLVNTAWKSMVAAAKAAGAFIREAFRATIEWFQANLLPMLRELAPVFVQAWRQIKIAFVEAWNQLKPAFAELKKAFNDLKPAFQIMLPVLKVVAVIIGVVLVSAFMAFINTIKYGVPVLVGLFRAALFLTVSSVRGVITAIRFMINLVMGAIRSFVIALVRDWNALKNNTIAAWRAISGGAVKAWNALKNATVASYNAIAAAVSRGVARVKSYWTGFLGFWKALPGQAKQIAIDVVNGLVQGFESAKGAVVNKVKEIADSIPNGVKKVLGIRSPSRVMIQLMRYTAQGIIKGLTGSSAQIKAAAVKTVNLINDAFPKPSQMGTRRWLRDRLAKDNAALLRLADSRTKVAAKLKAATSKVTSLISERSKAAADFADAVRGTFKVIGEADENGKPESVEAMLTRLQGSLRAANEFAAAISTLKKRGVATSVLEELISAGPEAGLETAKKLAGAQNSQLALLNQYAGKIGTIATSTGNVVAGAMFDAGIRAAQGVVKGLQSQEKAIENQMLRIARGMQAALKRALGIKSPSRVFAELGQFIPAGIAMGIQSASAVAEQAVMGLSGRMVGAFEMPNLAGQMDRATAAVVPGAASAGAQAGTMTSSVDNSKNLSIGEIITQAKSAEEVAAELEWTWRTAGS